jgi:hypothetical protein
MHRIEEDLPADDRRCTQFTTLSTSPVVYNEKERFRSTRQKEP